MEEKIQVRMTRQALYDFLLFHTYSKFAGFLTNILGAAVIFMGIILFFMGKADLLQLLFYLLAGIAFLAYTPLLIWVRTKKQVQLLPEYKEAVTYIFGETGITMQCGETEKKYPWENIQKVVPTPKTFGFYYEAEKALIIPKEDFGDRFQAVMQIVVSHVPRENVKVR